MIRDLVKAFKDFTLEPEEVEACDGAWYNLPRERDVSIARR